MPTPPAGVKVADGSDTLLNWLEAVLGPLTTDQAPVPTDGVFPDRVPKPVVVQIFCSEALTAVVGNGTTVMVNVASVYKPDGSVAL